MNDLINDKTFLGLISIMVILLAAILILFYIHKDKTQA